MENDSIAPECMGFVVVVVRNVDSDYSIVFELPHSMAVATVGVVSSNRRHPRR